MLKRDGVARLKTFFCEVLSKVLDVTLKRYQLQNNLKKKSISNIKRIQMKFAETNEVGKGWRKYVC